MKKILLIMLSACIFLCGCEIQMTTPETTTEATVAVIVTTELEEQPPEPEPYPVTVNDTVIEKKPERIVSLSPSLTEILFEMGYGNKVVGRGSYCDYPAETENLPDLGRPSKPDYNAVIALKPEILFTATSIPLKDRYKLEENGIKTVYIPYPTSMEEFERIYCAIGFVLEGKFDGEAKGKSAFSAVETAFGSVEKDLGSFVYITEGLTVATGDTFENSVLSKFGINIGADGKNYAYPKEYLIEFQPDFILLNDNYTIDDLLADETYSQLTAVVNGNVFKISNTYFERPSGRISALAQAIKEIG